MNADVAFIKQVKEMTNNKAFQERNIINPDKDFKRNRKLNFSDVIYYTIGNTRNPIELEAERFTKLLKIDKVSTAALCKARQKISYTAFKELFEETALCINREKTFYGYNVIAVDGMKGELPKTPELAEKYRSSPQSNIPIFHAVSAYDVLNEVFISSEFHFGGADERALTYDLIKNVKEKEPYKDEKQIWVFDRGFPSLLLLQKLMKYGVKFVIRVSKSFLKEVNEFRASKYVDKVVHINYTDSKKSTNHVKSDGICEFDLRCVRIDLKGSEEEILITNLKREEFPKRFIKELYKLRWDIETSYNYLKHAVFIEEFVTRSENGLKQDYFVSLLVYNFATCVCGGSNISFQKKES